MKLSATERYSKKEEKFFCKASRVIGEIRKGAYSAKRGLHGNMVKNA